MKQIWVGLGLFLSVAASAHVSPTQFQDWMKTGAKAPVIRVQTLLSAPARTQAQRTRYVFVKGFFGEAFRNSFRDMMHTLETLGVPHKHIYRVTPPSRYSMDQNLAFLKDQITPILRGNEDPIVIFGHSRGAVEVLAYVLSAPKDVRDRIHAVYLTQGAFGGSPLADFAVGENVPMDNRLPLAVQYVMNQVRSANLAQRIPMLERLTGLEFGEGLLSLSHKAQTEFWARHSEQNRAAATELNDRIYYLRGYSDPAKMSWTLHFPGVYMQMYYGANDGVIPFAYQALEGLGTPLATLALEHTSLVNSKKSLLLLAQRRAVSTAIYLASGLD